MEKQGRKTIPITPSLRLVPYYPAYETTLPWYQDQSYVTRWTIKTAFMICPF